MKGSVFSNLEMVVEGEAAELKEYELANGVTQGRRYKVTRSPAKQKFFRSTDKIGRASCRARVSRLV